jgi:hypothetical protein
MLLMQATKQPFVAYGGRMQATKHPLAASGGPGQGSCRQQSTPCVFNNFIRWQGYKAISVICCIEPVSDFGTGVLQFLQGYYEFIRSIIFVVVLVQIQTKTTTTIMEWRE